MLAMMVKMSLATSLYVILTILVWFWTKEKKISNTKSVAIGVVFGIASVLSTHFGIQYESMIINVRDIGPLAAGIFFSPPAGVLAGLIGGIERYIAGTYFGVSSYTRIACSVSTCLAGFVAVGMRERMIKFNMPSPFYSFCLGAVMEVFHMYVVFITHRSDTRMAFEVVSTCAIPMILFTGIGMAVSNICLQVLAGVWTNPLKIKNDSERHIADRFHVWLFVVTLSVFLGSFIISFALQTQSARQFSKSKLINDAKIIRQCFINDNEYMQSDSSVVYQIIEPDRTVIKGINTGQMISENEYAQMKESLGQTYDGTLWGRNSMIYPEAMEDGTLIVTAINENDMYWYRNSEAYEIALADILLFTAIYVLISSLLNSIVVNNVHMINKSLGEISNGNLDEVVNVRNCVEFSSLSDDINTTVDVLKGYIDAAEKRMEEELIFAKSIQESALPKVFNFPDRDEFELFATMKPAKEVGGDFYDFFFVSANEIALVIADVSGKGIPASLFMMRSKTAIRSFAETGGSPAEILTKANKTLCDGNDADMFVTVWIGILNLTTGVMQCANAGHEYPVIRRAGGEYELLKDQHSLVLAAMPEISVKQYELQFQPGDRLFVYTDGVPEATNEKNEQYGLDRMISALNEAGDKSINEILPIMSEHLNDFKGKAKQFDDITMLGFDYIKALN